MQNIVTWLPVAQAQGAQDPFAGMGMFLLLPLLLIVFFIFARRSQKRQAAEHEALVQSLTAGTKVMLNSGLIGLVDKVDKENQEVRLLIDEDKKVHARYNWGAVTKVFKEEVANVAKDEDKIKKDYK
ncbi:MAG: preprotein translocase subunit YajC [Planctomycetes bacterium]|nr:preprotein translocase subunit YajC [Planctomycetota bacterium]